MSEINITFFTIVARNYLAYAYTLGESIKEHHSDAAFLIFIVDDVEKSFAAEIQAKGFGVIYPEQISISNYLQFVFQYNITEASTAVKPFVLKHLIDNGATKVIYLDPDILCLQPFQQLLKLLDDYSIIITPHSNSPVTDDSFPTDNTHLYTGVYNLGFIAVSNTKVSKQFLEWWQRKLCNFCLDSPETGIFVDQKWIDLVPAFFPEVYIMRNLAYNVAYWNFHERNVEKTTNGWKVKENDELIKFFHFSGIRFDDLDKVTKYGPKSPFNIHTGQMRLTLSDKPDLHELYKTYREKLYAAGMEKYASIEYAYARYNNGEVVSPLERSLYWGNTKWHQLGMNPFSCGKDSFWHECRRKGIKYTKSKVTVTSTEDIVGNYMAYFRIIRIFLRIILFILGSTMYIKFTKYLREQLLLQNHGFLIK